MELEKFVDELIVEKGLNRDGPEVTAEIRRDLLESLERKINSMILHALSPADLGDFEKAIDSGSDTQVQAFLKKKIPNLDAKVASVLVAFRTTYI
jgi:hypothetical protein